MSANSQEIVQQIRAQFESLLQSVQTVTPQTPSSAYDIERSLLRHLLELGRMLLQLCFVTHSQHYQAPRVMTGAGQDLPYHSHKPRSYWSLFGKIRFERAYYYRKGTGYFALDAALNLPTTACSDLLHEWRTRLATTDAYQQVGQILSGILGQSLGFSTRALSEQIAQDGALVPAFYDAASVPPDAPQATLLVVQADGKGVPLVKSQTAVRKVRLAKGDKAAGKKEAIVTCVYTLVPWVRTPQEVVDSFFETKSQPYSTSPPAAPPHKRWWATLEGKAAAVAFTRPHATARDRPHITQRVALTDGAAPLQQQLREQFADFTLVLDLVHAVEYLWEVANALLGERAPKRSAWVQKRMLQMLSGQTPGLIAEFTQLAQVPRRKARVRKVLEQVAAYYERNLPSMQYDRYLAAGWPIATGVIEGACRHLVKDRCERSGMRWTRSGVEALLHLRCVSENGDWEAFEAFRQQQRLHKVYEGKPTSEPTALQDAVATVRLQLINGQAA